MQDHKNNNLAVT